MKTKIIAITLVLSLMIMGVAYAAWGETVRTYGTIKTGELNVDINSDTHSLQGYGLTVTSFTNDTVDYVRFEIGNMHPGASFETILEFENKGDIPVYVDLTKLTSNLQGVYHTLDVVAPNGDSMRGASDVGKIIRLEVGQIKNVKVKFEASINNTESTLRENGTYWFLLEFDVSQYNE